MQSCCNHRCHGNFLLNFRKLGLQTPMLTWYWLPDNLNMAISEMKHCQKADSLSENGNFIQIGLRIK